MSNLPFEPIDRLLLGSTRQQAQALGVSVRTLWRYRKDGIPYSRLDEVCEGRLGRSPWSLWPKEEILAACPHCN